jgi:hypothetical protein
MSTGEAHPLEHLAYSLRRGDVDRTIARDGVDGRSYGGRFHIGETHNWVARLCKVLGTLGFRFDDGWATLDPETPSKTFDAPVQWAVREFQAAAKMKNAARNGEPILLSTVAGAVYDGPVSGVVNEKTRLALGAWFTNNLRCPVDISGFGLVTFDERPGTSAHPQSNLWRDDEFALETRVFARDISEVYPVPVRTTGPPPAGERAFSNYQVVGAISKYGTRYGPLTDARHAWKRPNEKSEVVPGELFVEATVAALHTRQLATFRIVRAVTDAEAFGYFEGGNAYDSQVVSFGLFHWTVTPTGEGELVPFLAYVRQTNPEAYRKAFGLFGLGATNVWPRLAESADGFALLDAGGRKFSTPNMKVAYDTEEGPTAALPSGMTEQRYLRNWHAYYRFVMAARTNDDYRRGMWDLARMRLRMVMAIVWPPGTTADPFPFKGTVATPATYGDTFGSEHTLAMVLRWHVKSPGDVVGGREASEIFKGIWRTIRGTFGQHNTAAWGPVQERAWAAALLHGFEHKFTQDFTMRKIDGWQDVGSIADAGFQLPTRMPANTDSVFPPIDNTGDTQQAVTELMAAPVPTDNPPPQPPTIHWVDMPAITSRLREAIASQIAILASDRLRFARVKVGTHSKWAVEIRDEHEVLKRRFQLTRQPANAAHVESQEVPILGEERDFGGTSGFDRLDVSGLPRFKVDDENATTSLVSFVSESAPGGQLAAVVTAFTSVTTGAGTLSGTPRVTFFTAVSQKLPLTDIIDPGAIAAISLVESDATGPSRWLVATTNPNLKFLTVRRATGSATASVEVDQPGLSRRYGGDDLTAGDNNVNVALLCNDLRTLGFLGVSASPTPLGTRLFDAPVRAAVRAFQAYARRATVAREPSSASGIWVKRLAAVDVSEPLRYHGEIDGVVNNETRVLLDHWIAEPNRWRCPVVVDARTSTTEGLPASAPDASFPTGSTNNLWGADEGQGAGLFLFVTDFSAPGTVKSKQLGLHRGGPSVRNETGFTPAVVPINRAMLTDNEWDTPEAQSTARVLGAVSLHLPCQGFIDGVDATTIDRIISLGAFYLQDTTDGGTPTSPVLGGLGVLMSLSRAVEPAAFGLGFGRDGSQSSRPWTDAGLMARVFNDDPSGRLLAGVRRPETNRGHTDLVQANNADEWRGWHFVYRLASAARVKGMPRAYYDLARFGLLTLGSLRVTMPVTAVKPTQLLNEVFTSERDWGVLHFWHAKFPGEVVVKVAGARKASPNVETVIANVTGATHAVPPVTTADQDALTAALAAMAQSLHVGPGDLAFRDAVDAIVGTPSGLGGAPGSFRIDIDHLPDLPAAVGANLLHIVIRLGPAAIPAPPPTPTPPPPTPPPLSVGLSGTYDSVAKVFKATHVALTAALTPGFHAISLALENPRAFGMEIDEASAAPVTVAGAPGEAPQDLQMVRVLNGSDLTGLTSAPFQFDPSQVLAATAFPIAGRLDLGGLTFDAGGDLQGRIRALFDLNLPFGGGPTTVSLAGRGDNAGPSTFSQVALDEAGGKLSAMAEGFGDVLAALPGWPFDIPANTPFALTAVPADDRFAFSLAPAAPLANLALNLVPTLVNLDLQGVGIVLDSRTGLGIDLPSGVERVKAALASELFAAAGADAVINHATELIEGAAGDIGKLFRLSPSDPSGALVGDAARVVAFDGRTPRISGALLASLTNLEVNTAKRLRSFAGELLGAADGAAARMHAKFAKATGDVTVGHDAERGVWFVEVPLGLRINDEQNHAADPDATSDPNAVQKRDLFAVQGRFRFEVQGDSDFAQFDPGTFTVAPEVEVTVNDLNAARGRSFAGLVSLHVPDGSVFVFSTDPTRASLRWDKEKSQANNKGKILLRVPASDGLEANPDLNAPDPGGKRFTFELDSFAVSSAGIDIGGAVRVEKVGLNDNDSEPDDQTKTGLQAPLSVQKADPKPPGAADDDPIVGTIHFKNSRLVNGSLKAGFQLRFFDDATGTLSVLMAEDPATKNLSVTGTVEINTPTEYRFDPLFATFQLKSLRFSTTYKRDSGKVTWSSEGAIAGAVKFLPPAGKSASGELSALSDFFAGVTCEFEDLNPVKLGRGAEVTFNFPTKTFNLANVMEVDLSGITVGDSKNTGGNHRFSLLGNVRLKDLPGVDGSLTFGGIDLTQSKNGLPELTIKTIGAALTIPGGVEIDATFSRIKSAKENGFAGAMTVRSDALPAVSGLIKLTEVQCRDVDRVVPSMALYLGADIDAPLVFGFYLRNLGLGVGIFQALRGLDSSRKSLPMPQRVIRFVDDQRGLPSPGVIDSWVPDPPARPRGKLNWMLVAQALITYGKFPPDRPHVLAGTLLAALDQDLTFTAATNIWLFASPQDVVQPDFLEHPAARGAMQISPREGKVFGYFRTLPNPKLGAEAPPILGQVLNQVQTSYMFLADRNGFLTEVGWPWQTRATFGLPSPLRGELTAGFRYGIYRGVVVFGLNFGIDVQLDAEAGIDFKTPLGSAGARLVVHGAGYFRASFVGALDQAFRPYLLGDVRVAATVSVRAEAHAELSRKITRWLKIRLRIRFSASFDLSIAAALSAAMNENGAIGFSGDAHVSVCVSGYRISGQVPFQCSPERVDQVRARLAEILPPPVTEAGASPSLVAPAGIGLGLALAGPPTNWQTRSRRVPGTRRVLVSLLPAPGVAYPPVADPDVSAPATDRFKVKLNVADTAFVGFLADGRIAPTSGTLTWSEDFEPSRPLLRPDDLRVQDGDNQQLIDDEGTPDSPAPRALTLALFLHGISGADPAPSEFSGGELVDRRTVQPAPDDVDDDTVGVTPAGVLSPNFGRDRAYDERVSQSCSRSGEPTPPIASPEPVEGASFSLIAAEALDLFGRDSAALSGTIPTSMFVAHRLRGTLVFDLPDDAPSNTLLTRADDGEDVSAGLIDPASFRVLGAATPLDSALAGSAGRAYDLIPGHVFQSQEMIALCWEFRFQDQKANDPFEAYRHGFDHFRLTRTNQSNARGQALSESLNACWLDPSQGGRAPAALLGEDHVRPPYQYVDRAFSDPDDASSNAVRTGDLLLYRIEAIGPAGKVLTSCLFEVVRRIVAPLASPAAALALHRPAFKDSATLVDCGSVELTLLWAKDEAIPQDELRVRFRLVAAGTVGSYGFDAPPTATTHPDPGLPKAAATGLGAKTVQFSASPQGRPMPWEETRVLEIKPGDWKRLTVKGVVPVTSTTAADEIGARVELSIDDLSSLIKKALGTEPGRGRAIELWVGRERPEATVDSIERSILTPFRHAVVLPNTEPAETVVDTDYVTRGSTVAAIEAIPPRAKSRPPASRFLAPGRIVAAVVGSNVPPGVDPNTLTGDINDVRLALAWRMPSEDDAVPFNPVVAFRIYRVDRFNPALYRATKDGIAPRLESFVTVVPERLYRATPDAIELLPITRQGDDGVMTIVGDWRPERVASDGALWSISSVPAASKPFPFRDDPDRAGATCIHVDVLKVAKKIAAVIETVTGDAAKPLWRTREPFEDRADLQAADDRTNIAARGLRFQSAFEAFRAAHGASSDPYGWSTAEELGLSGELIFVRDADNEPVDLDGLIRNGGLLGKLHDTTETAPVAVLLFHAEDGETILDAVRLLHVGPLPAWNDSAPTVFAPKVVLGLKLLGLDPTRRDSFPYGDDYPAGPDVTTWLKGDVARRLQLGFGAALATSATLTDVAGKVVVYRRDSATGATGSAPPRRLPIDRDGTVRLDLPVPDRLAHVYDVSLEPIQRYDAIWDALAPATSELPAVVPFEFLRPVAVDRTRPLVPHNVVATPLPGAAQVYVFAHPAEFAACASALNAAAIRYAGHWPYMQRRIPELSKIMDIFNDRSALAVDWASFSTWLSSRNYEAVDFSGAGREIVLTPPVGDDLSLPSSATGDPLAMRMSKVTRVGIFGADRYVTPDLPAYYEYRFAAVSAAGAARSAPAFSPFVRPLFDKELQPPSTDGLVNVSFTGTDSVTLEVVLGHARLHLRTEMRGLWVDSDDKLSLPQSSGSFVAQRFGSLPDLSLLYQVLVNANYDPANLSAFKVLNTLVTLIPPLDPQRQTATSGAARRFLARSSDVATVKVVAMGGTEGREAEVAYRQSTVDGSIRLVVRLRLGDTPDAAKFREIFASAPSGRAHEPFVFIVSRGGVQSAVVAGAIVGT